MIWIVLVPIKKISQKKLYMFKAYERLENILEKINYIEEIVEEKGGITKALEDKKLARASILMHFMNSFKS